MLTHHEASRAGGQARPPPVSGGVLPGPPCLAAHGPGHELSRHLPPPDAGMLTRPFAPSFLRPQSTHIFKNQGLELARKDP